MGNILQRIVLKHNALNNYLKRHNNDLCKFGFLCSLFRATQNSIHFNTERISCVTDDLTVFCLNINVFVNVFPLL